MQSFIAKVGRGQKTWRDLTWEEAKQAMQLLVEGRATPEQVGAFVTAMRIKMESVTELAAFTSVARGYIPPLALSSSDTLVDLPLYSGKKDTFQVSISAAIVAAAGGVSVLIHGVDSDPARSGVAQVLQGMKLPTEFDGAQVANQVQKTGFGFLNLELYHPPVARYLRLKNIIGLRNFFQPIAKMLNPGRAAVQVIGVSHPPYLGKIAEALVMVGGKRALVVRGIEGEPELSVAGHTKMMELREGRITPLSMNPKELGMPVGTSRDMAGYPLGNRWEEATLLQRILRNQVKGGPRQWVLMNAALLLYAAGKTSSISKAVPLVTEILESGKAAAKLEELQTYGEAHQPRSFEGDRSGLLSDWSAPASPGHASKKVAS